MPPTIQSGKSPPKRSGTLEKRSELVCRVKYCNSLPDIPFDPKFINYPFESNRYVSYNPTSLERNYKHDLLTEPDLGVTIDLILPNTYISEDTPELEFADERLLEEDILAPQDSKRSRHHAKNVPWLRRTEYISTEITRFRPTTMDKVESKVGFSIKKQMEDNLYMDRESQIAAIQKTFDDVKQPVTEHYSKPGVTAVSELPIFPDFALWKYPCAQVIFDSDPAPLNMTQAQQVDIMSQAMIRGVMDEFEEQFVAYFLPSESTIQKRVEDISTGVDYRDEEEYDYVMHREYNWNVKNKASKGYEENYFIVTRDDAMYYNELETRVRLSKRRQKGSTTSNSRLVVSHRPLNNGELRVQRYREKQLLPPGEDDEEEEDSSSSESEKSGKSGAESEGGEANSERRRSRSASTGSNRSGGSGKSRGRSGTKSGSSSRSSSGASQKSGSGRRSSASGSPDSRRSGSGSPASQRSGSGSAQSRRSRSGSPRSQRSGSASPRSQRSGSGSPKSQRSGSGSPKSQRSGSGSPKSQRSGSGSARSQRSGSRSSSSGSSRSRSSSGGSNTSKRSASSNTESGSASDSGSDSS